MLTALRPTLARVKGTEYQDLYLKEGEPIGVRHLCAAGTKALFGVELEKLQSAKVKVTAEIIDEISCLVEQ